MVIWAAHIPADRSLLTGGTAGKMKLEFLENLSSTLLGFSRISNLIQAHFWDSLFQENLRIAWIIFPPGCVHS